MLPLLLINEFQKSEKWAVFRVTPIELCVDTLITYLYMSLRVTYLNNYMRYMLGVNVGNTVTKHM